VKGFLPPSVARHYGDFYDQQRMDGMARNWKVSTSMGLESSDVMTIGTPSNMLIGETRE